MPLTISTTRPRILFSDPGDFALARAAWASRGNHSPGSTASAKDMWQNGLAYLFGSAAQQAAALANLTTQVFSWLQNWAYQGTAGSPTLQISVGAWAPQMLTSSAGSDHYRWAEWFAPVVDWMWPGLTAQQQQLLSGYTITWAGAGPFLGQQVQVPSYSTIAANIARQVWGGAAPNSGHPNGMPGNNYFWGNLRNEINWGLAIAWEDAATSAALLAGAIGSGPTSRWSVVQSAYASGCLRGGMWPEGAEYGRYALEYGGVPFWSLKRQGRDLWAECNFHHDATLLLVYLTSPQQVAGDSGATYWQLPPWGDIESWGGYPPAAPIAGNDNAAGSFNYGNFMTLMKLEYGAAVLGQYAAQWLAHTGAAVSDQISFLDPGTILPRDWRLDSLSNHLRAQSGDQVVSHSDWSGNESLVYVQGHHTSAIGHTTEYSHTHHDPGSWEVMRGAVWLAKEATEYAAGAAQSFCAPAIRTQVAASPVPTATSFALTNLPTTSAWGSGLAGQFTSGALSGTPFTIPAGGYTGSSGLVTLSAPLAHAPAAGDRVKLIAASEATGGANPRPVITCRDAAAHQGLWVGGAGMVNSSYQTNFGTTAWFDFVPGAWWGMGVDLSGCYTATDHSHPQYTPGYAASVAREYYELYGLECLVILDRIQAQDFAGSAYFPAWTAASMPRHWFMHSPTPPVVDGPAQFLVTSGSQALRGLTLLPLAPGYNLTDTSAFAGAHDPDTSFYPTRLEVQDNPGTAQSYFLHVLQRRGSSEADVSCTLLDQGASWKLTITHATRGSAVLVLNKGAVSTEGSVTLSGSAPPPPPPTAPQAPTGLAVTATLLSEIDLAWTDNDPTHTTGIMVQQALDSGFTQGAVTFPLGPVAAAFADTGLAPGTTYWFRVWAVNAVGPSGYSNYVSATTPLAPLPPLAPSGLTVTLVTATEIDLAWADNDLPHTTGIVLERSSDPSFSPASTTTFPLPAGAVSYADTGLPSPSTWLYRVHAINAVGPSGYSNVVSGTTLAPQPPPPDPPPQPPGPPPVQQGNAPLLWTPAGTRTGDGALALPVAPAYYFAYAAGSLSVAGEAPISAPLIFLASRAKDSFYDRFKLAIQAAVQVLSLSGLATPPGNLPASRVYLYPTLKEELLPLLAYPCITVTDYMVEQYQGGTNLRDDIGYPVLVSIIDRAAPEFNAPFATYYRWREQVARFIRHQRLPGLAEAYTVDIEPQPPGWRPPQWDYYYSSLVFRGWTRDPRGV